MNDGPLKQFSGISAGRDIKQGSYVLEKLIHLGDEIVSQYTRDFFTPGESKRRYIRVHQTVSGELNNTEFNEGDLKSLVLAMIHNDYSYNQSRNLGIYTGTLLHILTERNRAKGKRTEIQIDGGGGSFDFLFYCCREADDLVLHNINGNSICMQIGSHGGDVGNILLSNHKGDEAFCNAGSYGGKFGSIMLVNSEGKYSARDAATEGYGGLILVGNSKGHGFADIAGTGGHVDALISINVEGSEIASNAGKDKGGVALLFFENCKGDDIGRRISYEDSLWIEVVMNCFDNKGKPVEPYMTRRPKSEHFPMVRGRSALKKYKAMSIEYGLGEIVELVNKMKDASMSEIVSASRKILEIHKTKRGDRVGL